MITNKNLYKFSKYDLTVITLDSVFESIQLCLSVYIDILYNIERFNSDAKALLLHNLLLQTCEHFKKLNNHSNKILLVQPSFADYDYEIYKHFDKQKITNFIITNFKKISNNLPFPVYVQNTNTNLNDKYSGETIELLNRLVKIKDTFQLKSPSLSKIKQFTFDHGLNYLTNVYLLKPETKGIYYQKQ